jgi:hypothetical protein
MTAAGIVPWYRERSLRWLLTWTALTTIIFWLPTVRGAFDGPSYRWGLFGFSGNGMAGAWWLPVLGSVAALTARSLAWRGGLRPASLLIGAWHAALFAGVVYAAVTNPDDFRLQGDTMGINISLALVGPALFGAGAALAVYVGVRTLRRDIAARREAWTPSNTRWLAALLALLPIQFILLRLGSAGSTADQIGVLLTIAQWLLLDRALRPPAGGPADA